MKRGFDVLRNKTLNRSIIFSRKERHRLGLRGLLPHRISTEEQMVERVMENLDRMPRDIDRYMQLSALQERNERLFYRTVIDHVDRIMPLIYTPTVGEACKEFSHIARDPKGFFITPDDMLIFDFPGAAGLTSLNGINRNGYICGRYADAAGILHGFLAKVNPHDTDSSSHDARITPLKVVTPTFEKFGRAGAAF